MFARIEEVAVIAALGGIAYVCFWRLYKREEAIRHVVLSGITGIIYSILRSDYGFPDLIVTFVVGWFAPDFLSGLVERLKSKKPEVPVPSPQEGVGG